MGNKNSGRRPQPTALKKLRGTLRTNETNYREPFPPPAPESIDTPPVELKGDTVAIAEWRRVVPMLRRIGVISETEQPLLISLCQAWSIYLAAHAQVRTGGMVIDTEKGPVVSPFLAVSKDAWDKCHKLWIDLGISPSARSRISTLITPEPKQQSKWAGLL